MFLYIVVLVLSDAAQRRLVGSEGAVSSPSSPLGPSWQ